VTQPVDDLDSAIIRELEADGRRPFREIARTLNVSEATIRARFRRLTESGLLKIVAFSDPAAMSRSRLAVLFLTVEPQQHYAVAAALTERDEVSYVSTVMGGFDIFVQVLVQDDFALWTFIQEVVRPMAGVLASECMLELRVHKLWFENPILQ
jgi:Lrp/AsnC family transcriptional regulator for asnA, asnC and gidA